MSRLKVARLPGSSEHPASVAGTVEQAAAAAAAHVFCDAEEKRVPGEVVLRNASGKVQRGDCAGRTLLKVWRETKPFLGRNRRRTTYACTCLAGNETTTTITAAIILDSYRQQ